MGCWNETCMVSNLPIESEDEVVLFVLDRTAGAHVPSTYPSDQWTPLSTPIFGKYDSYGCIKVDRKEMRPSWQAFMRLFEGPNARRFHLDADDFKTHAEELRVAIENNHPKNFEFLETILRAVERGDVYRQTPFLSSDWHRTNKPENGDGYIFHRVVIAMIHRKVYDLLMEHGETESYWPKFKRSQEFEKIDPFLESLCVHAADPLMFRFGYTTEFDKISPSMLPQTCGGEGYGGMPISDHLLQLQEKLTANDLDWCRSFMQDCVNVRVVYRALDEMRKFWTPTSGKGSQDADLDLHKKLARLITDHTSQYEEEKI